MFIFKKHAFYKIHIFIVIGFSAFAYAEQEELPIVVVIPSYNNAQSTTKTLDSVFTQKYTNFRVIYIDDASEDGTANVVLDYVKKNNVENKILLIRNNSRCRKLKNIYNAIHSCHDWEIVVQIDGDDRLAHEDVFSVINTIYASKDVWLTYGQYRNEPKEEAEKWGFSERGYARAVPDYVFKENKIREYKKWPYMHLRTFYAWLFKLIKLEDLLTDAIPGFEGKFYPASNDVAVVTPMLEMTGGKLRFIPEVLYVRNLYSPLVGFKVNKSLQIAGSKEILGTKIPYNPIPYPLITDQAALKKAQADCVVLSHDNPAGLVDVLNSIKAFISDVDAIKVIYSYSNSDNANLYRDVSVKFPSITFIHPSIPNNIITYIKEAVSQGSEHVICANDHCTINSPIDANFSIQSLEQTDAYGFYLGFNIKQIKKTGKNTVFKYQNVKNNVCAWKFKHEDQWFNSYNNFSLTLYRKKNLITQLNELSDDIKLIKDFEKAWHNHKNSQLLNKIGLFLE